MELYNSHVGMIDGNPNSNLTSIYEQIDDSSCDYRN